MSIAFRYAMVTVAAKPDMSADWSMIGVEVQEMETRIALDENLERSFHLGPGPEKERQINRLALALISGLVRDASPEAREVWFDWDQEGLCITSIRDGQGEPCIAPDEVDELLSTYASNVQDSRYAPQLTVICGTHGPFVLQI